MESTMEFEEKTYRKVDWRLMPFLFMCYILAYLDRVNVGLRNSRCSRTCH